MTDLTTPEPAAILGVLDELHNIERDLDHQATIESARTAVDELVDGDITPRGEISEETVRTAAEALERLAPSQEELREYDGLHPDRIYSHALEFLDHHARYVNGELPSYREWTAEYYLDGEHIHTAHFDHDDEVETDPVIDGTSYKRSTVVRGDGMVKVELEEVDG